jgi:hypothetical protein
MSSWLLSEGRSAVSDAMFDVELVSKSAKNSRKTNDILRFG